jgi:Ca2+-binding EF-hand superfamily protein
MMTRLPMLLLALAAVPAFAQTPPKPAAPAPARPPAAANAQDVTPERMFSEWDTDKNRQLSLAEFKAGVENARMAELIARLEQQFRKADANGNKKLEAGEYAALPAIKRGGASAPPLATFDANKDQALDFQEFLAMVQAFIRSNSAGK